MEEKILQRNGQEVGEPGRGVGDPVGGSAGESAEEPSGVPGGKSPEDIKERAVKKLEKELEGAEHSPCAGKVIGYLARRCEEDCGLAEDVMQEHKTWEKCFDYFFNLAMKQSKHKVAWVDDEVVYEWAEDYYRKDDKAEAEKKAKQEAERKKKEKERRKKAAEKKKAGKEKAEKEKADKAAEEPPKERPKAKPKAEKKTEEADGQMDMFEMLGL